MGQYYVAIILSDKGKIKFILNPCQYSDGVKLMEHAYNDKLCMIAMETLLNPEGIFYMSPVVWAGDYAEPEPDDHRNLYHLSQDEPYKANLTVNMLQIRPRTYRYVINHTKQMYVDKNKCANDINPLPLLTADGNGCGGGDYRGAYEHLCGSWARHIISVDNAVPDGYKELDCRFEEY